MRDNRKKGLQLFLTKKYQISLAVLIPFFLVLFALGPLYVAVTNIGHVIPTGGISAELPSHDALREMRVMFRLIMWISGFTALAVGILLAYSILSPARTFFRNLGISLPDTPAPEREDDFGILGRDFNLMMHSLGRYVSILEGMSGGVMVFDGSGRVTAVNPSAEGILGRSARDLNGMSVSDICSSVVRSPDMENVIWDGLQQGLLHASREVRLRVPEGDEIIIGLTTSLIRDASSDTAGLVATLMDLTGIQRMHEDLQQRLRMAGLGRLAAGMAHEVRNPLGAIKGMAQLIQEGLPDGDPRKKYGSVIERESDRLNVLVEELLSLAHGPNAFEPGDINALLVQARELARPGFGARKVEVTDEPGELPLIIVERGRLVQAFLNIFLNALEAVPDGGRVWFTTSYLRDSRAVSVTIGNTGAPIASEVKERMFDPFFTTKEMGSGLGLAIAHQIITSHGGTISAMSTDDETVFQVMLPEEQ